MNNPNEKEQDLARREKEILERERALRLQEMETEIYQEQNYQKGDAPFVQTRKDNPPEGKMKQWLRKAVNVGKFLGVVVAVIVAVKVAYWLALTIMVAGVGFVAYKLFLENKNG
jgi:hypothetical protein